MLTSQNATEVGCRVCELVLLVIPVLQCNEDAQVVRSSHNTHTRTSELGAQLVVSLRTYALLWTVDVEGGNGRVVGGLLGEVRDGDSLAIASHAVGTA